MMQPRLLLVDDEPALADFLADAARQCGFEPVLTSNDRQFRDAFGEQTPDLVALDLGMPGMDGYQLAARLRQEPALAGVRIVVMTGFDQEADRQQSKDAGFDAHLVKPLDFEELSQLLLPRKA